MTETEEEKSERLTAHCKKWAKEYRLNTFTELTELDVDNLEEKMRECVEEWIGETRQAPLQSTMEEHKKILKSLLGPGEKYCEDCDITFSQSDGCPSCDNGDCETGE